MEMSPGSAASYGLTFFICITTPSLDTAMSPILIYKLGPKKRSDELVLSVKMEVNCRLKMIVSLYGVTVDYISHLKWFNTNVILVL